MPECESPSIGRGLELFLNPLARTQEEQDSLPIWLDPGKRLRPRPLSEVLYLSAKGKELN